MRVGVFFKNNQLGGGIYQYSLNVLTALYFHGKEHEVKAITDDPAFLRQIGLDVEYATLKNRSRAGKFLTASSMMGLKFPRLFFQDYNSLKNEIDLLIFPYPTPTAVQMKIPYIIAIHDLMHRVYPHFPEYPLIERFRRDTIYKHCAKSSLVTVADSELGREHLADFLDIPKNRTVAVPFIPQSSAYDYGKMSDEESRATLRKFALPEQYLFYPAQFWFHKNHLNLLKAILLLERERGEKINLVLAGSAKDNSACVMEFIKTNSMNNVHALGFVNEKEIIALYKLSKALVYPSLFGPTNIPPLEAMVVGTPVLCSNLFAMPEQLGDAALFFDPFSVEDIADKISLIWKNESLRQELIEKGHHLTAAMTLENYVKKWEEILTRVEFSSTKRYL
jgi:glycosyltransferase involved in cell wall biosynthesis